MFEASIKQTEPMAVAYISMRGPYQQIPLAMGMLYGWVQRRGLEPTGVPMGVYMSEPQTVPESEAVWEVWAPVAGEAEEVEPGDAGIGVKTIPAMTVASTIHRGPYESVSPTYEALGRWATEQGYYMAGPPREAYLSPPEVPPADTLTEVMFPVQKA
jgi:AraC family transcriptional regulator